MHEVVARIYLLSEWTTPENLEKTLEIDDDRSLRIVLYAADDEDIYEVVDADLEYNLGEVRAAFDEAVNDLRMELAFVKGITLAAGRDQ